MEYKYFAFVINHSCCKPTTVNCFLKEIAVKFMEQSKTYTVWLKLQQQKKSAKISKFTIFFVDMLFHILRVILNMYKIFLFQIIMYLKYICTFIKETKCSNFFSSFLKHWKFRKIDCIGKYSCWMVIIFHNTTYTYTSTCTFHQFIITLSTQNVFD